MNANNVSQEFINSMDRKITLRLVPLLILGYFFANLDRFNIGIAKIHMSIDLSFSDTMYGLGAGLFFIAYALFSLPSNIALEKFGAKKWICVIMVLWGAISALMYMVKTPEQFYVLRFLLGAAEAGFFPGVILYITRWFPVRRRATITAWFTLAVPIAGMLCGPISGAIIQLMHEIGGLKGWQWMFIIEGIPAILLAMVVLKYLPDEIATTKWLSQAEKDFLMSELSAEENSKKEPVKSFAGIFLNKYVWILVIVYFSVRLSINTLAFWTPTFINGAGVTSSFTIGVFTSLPYIAGVLFMFYLGKSSDKTGERRWHLFTPILMCSVGLGIAGIFSGHIMGVVLGLILAGMGSTAALPLYWQLPQIFLSSSTLAAGLAIISAFGSAASFGAPYMIGWMRDNLADQGMALYVISFIIFLGALTVLLIPKDSSLQKEKVKSLKVGGLNKAT